MSNDTTHPESYLLQLLQDEGLGEGGQALGLDENGQIVIYTGYRYVPGQIIHDKGARVPIPKVANKRITKDIF